MTQATSRFVYVTYIRATPERLWQALTDPEENKAFWLGASQVSEWTPGAKWELFRANGSLADSGEILEADKPRKIAIRWQNHLSPELEGEGATTCVMEIEPVEGAVKLTIDHRSDVTDSKVIHAVSGGWPKILSNLKSLLETGAIVLP